MSYRYTLYDYYDVNTENGKEMSFTLQLTIGQKIRKDNVTYKILECDYWGDGKSTSGKAYGRAIIQMTRYKIPDSATQFIHKCPAKKKAMEKIDADDVIKLEKKFGKKGAAKRIKSWKAGRAKLQSYNKLETKCPMCGCVFYKKHNTVPDVVYIDGVMNQEGEE